MKKIVLLFVAVWVSFTAFAQNDGLWETNYTFGTQDLYEVLRSGNVPSNGNEGVDVTSASASNVAASESSPAIRKAGSSGSGSLSYGDPLPPGSAPVGALAWPFVLLLAAYAGCLCVRRIKKE